MMGPTAEKLLLLFHTIKLLLMSFNQKWFGKSQYRKKKNPKNQKTKRSVRFCLGGVRLERTGLTKGFCFVFTGEND